MADLGAAFQLAPSALGTLTSSVQFGFICGTLVFTLLALADRFSPSKVFFASALAGAVLNLGMVLPGHTLWSLVLLRFAVGFSLAGIYPVGMKLAADYFQQGLGKSLGWLVGALVLGTAFPHLLKALSGNWPWKAVIVATSALALSGGALIGGLVPDGPFRKKGQQLNFRVAFQGFAKPAFRAAALGYWGHMWELYAFWTFVPWLVARLPNAATWEPAQLSLWSFIIIAVGSGACVLGGYWAQKTGTRKAATAFLVASGSCCLLSPWLTTWLPLALVLVFLLFWGMVVIADSPLFSTLVAQNAPPEWKGTALTLVNGVGFGLTIVSIQLLQAGVDRLPPDFLFWLLLPGPILGSLALLLTVREGRA